MKSLANKIDSQPLLGLAQIMRLAFEGNNLAQLTSELATRIQADANDAAALLDLSLVLQLHAQPEMAMELQSQALQRQQHFRLQSSPGSPSLRLLAIMSPGEVMANTPLEFLLEDSDVALELLYLGEGLPAPRQIPEHDIAFVAVCESDQNQDLLRQLHDIMRHWPRPFINSPANIALLSRDAVSRKLGSTGELVASDARRLSREETSELTDSHRFPIIARPVNSHAGLGLAKLNVPTELSDYLTAQDDAEFFIAPFIDYRSPDGWYRKYRIAVIDGQPYAAHMAISQKWMVHYLNADMLQNEKNRAEEARFMRNFDSTFAIKHRRALKEIDQRIGLQYYSIDCAETVDGRLLVFELDSGAVVHAMDPADVFPYKAPQMKRVFAAFRAMLYRRLRGARVSQAA
jgi:hypothetical protein